MNLGAKELNRVYDFPVGRTIEMIASRESGGAKKN
jgi:hypothetical protein